MPVSPFLPSARSLPSLSPSSRAPKTKDRRTTGDRSWPQLPRRERCVRRGARPPRQCERLQLPGSHLPSPRPVDSRRPAQPAPRRAFQTRRDLLLVFESISSAADEHSAQRRPQRARQERHLGTVTRLTIRRSHARQDSYLPRVYVESHLSQPSSHLAARFSARSRPIAPCKPFSCARAEILAQLSQDGKTAETRSSQGSRRLRTLAGTPPTSVLGATSAVTRPLPDDRTSTDGAPGKDRDARRYPHAVFDDDRTVAALTCAPLCTAYFVIHSQKKAVVANVYAAKIPPAHRDRRVAVL